MFQKQKKLNRRLAALFAAVLLLLCTVPVAYAVEGTCGDDLTWELKNGMLTITGSGRMYDYSEWEKAPWYDRREEILWLSLPEGLTNVGSQAFYDCVNLTAVTLPSTVTYVSELAFCQCYDLSILRLNEGLTSIGRSAFEQCNGLYDLRLPESLTTIDDHAFYRCAGLRYVQVPAGVTEMGSGVFAYCEALIQAEIYAPLDTVPGWTFYGCEQLNQVALSGTVKHTEENAFERCENLKVVDYKGGTRQDAKNLSGEITQDLPRFEFSGYVNVSGIPVTDAAQSVTVKDTNADAATLTTTTVIATPNATVTTSKDSTYVAGAGFQTASTGQVSASVRNDDGWDEVLNEILKLMKTIEAEKMKDSPKTSVEVKTTLANGSTEIPRKVLDDLDGKTVELTIETETGGKFVLDCTDLGLPEANTGKKDKENNKNEPENNSVVSSGFTYTISAAETAVEALGGAVTYDLRFHGEESIHAEVLIRLPGGHAYQKAYLYQRSKNGVALLQTVIVDAAGFAHFFLGRVDNETEYLVGINVPQKANGSTDGAAYSDASAGQAGGASGTSGNAIIPKSLYSTYGVTQRTEPIQYVITGHKSSWGMNINQVTWIMIGGMVVVVAVVGVTMFLLNRRKLRMGYVPDLGDEDDA